MDLLSRDALWTLGHYQRFEGTHELHLQGEGIPSKTPTEPHGATTQGTRVHNPLIRTVHNIILTSNFAILYTILKVKCLYSGILYPDDGGSAFF